MSNQVKMTLREIDFAVARNLMKWRRMTKDVVDEKDLLVSDSAIWDQDLDPHWFDGDGRSVAAAENCGSRQLAEMAWSPTRDPIAAQQVRSKLGEKFRSVILEQMAIGALCLFSLMVHRPVDEKRPATHMAFGPTEEIATCLCALECVGIRTDIADS